MPPSTGTLLLFALAATSGGSRADAVSAVAPNLASGAFVALVDDYGPLVCPQSRTTQQGLGHCVGVVPLGAAVTHAAGGADVFVQCTAQHDTGPGGTPQGGSFTYRFPFSGRDAATGAPVFAAPVLLPPWNAQLPALSPRTVWQPRPQVVHAAAFTSDRMHLLELSANRSTWRHLNTFKLALPSDWVSALRSVAVVPKSDQAGGWTVFTTLAAGFSERAYNMGLPHSTWRSASYQPYGGDGIYRGQLTLTGVAAFDLSAGGEATGFRVVTPAGWTGGLMGLKIAAVSLNSSSPPALVAASRAGVVYIIGDAAINSHGGRRGADDGGDSGWRGAQAEARPVPLADSTTGVLFAARVIGAAPIGYPKTAGDRSEGGDNLIFGGENALHFAAAAAAAATVRTQSGNKAGAGFGPRGAGRREVGLRHAGPVLLQGATLVTGQTPTVSIADWDGDGVLDIIAGSSEGRMYLARGAATGFHRPVTLAQAHAGPGGATTEEILVQGGYRLDIQGPAESRWGYTAPTAVDWNDDGLVDLVSSDNSARTTVYMRYRTPGGDLGLLPGVALKLDGLVLHGTWRNGPACGVVGGRMALVTSDEQDEAHIYYRLDDHNIEDGGKLLVRHREGGGVQNIQTNYLHAGGSGRLKYALADFDGDGLLDLLLGTCGYHAVPSNTTGLPACSPGPGRAPSGKAFVSSATCANNGATALLMRQARAQRRRQPDGEADQLVFEWPEWITVNGSRVAFGGQELGIAPLRAADGGLGLVLATPGGGHIFWAAGDIGTSVTEPPLQPP